MSTMPPIVKASASSTTATTKTTTKTTTTVNMAIPRTTKAKPAAAKAAKANSDSSPASKQKAQMHRRSRTGIARQPFPLSHNPSFADLPGCYTCRLRRKKCDEGSPMCTACNHLGLGCEYKRPHWWSNNEARRKQKEEIKAIIKRKKLSEKTTAQHTNVQSSVGSPPGLSHSLPTSATFSDPFDRTRSTSVDSHLSFNFNSPPPSSSDYGMGSASAFSTPQLNTDFMFTTAYPTPYDVDIKTERQMFVNDVPTLHESTTSTFSTFHTPPPPGTVLPPYPCSTPGSVDAIDGACMGAPAMGLGMGAPASEGGEWMEQVYSERRESMTEETLNMHFFDFSHGPSTDSRQVAIELDEGDQRLLDHFVHFVLPSIFPILETNQHGSVASDLILPALQSNKCYLHCCLSIAAQHLKAVLGEPHGSELDADVMRHRYATISTLCAALPCEENYQQILEATLGMIFFQCSVGRLDDELLDVPWHQHFQAAVSVVQKLDLPRIVTERLEVPSQEPQKASPQQQTPFNMTLTAWIDILGATMQGRAPTFAHTYREKHLSPAHATSLGLRELMGCEDRVMYLISEIACLEALKAGGMGDIMLCQHVSVLGDQIGLTEMGEAPVKLPFSASGTLSPKQLSKNMTAAFRLAARVYLCSLVPGFHPAQPSCIGLVEKLTAVLQMIPCGPLGFDKSVVWVYLMAGAVSVPGSPFRDFFAERIEQMGEQAYVGSFGRVVSLLHEVWHQQDLLLQQQVQQPASPESVGSSTSDSQQQYVHWRDVMQMNGWDFLLI